MVVRAIPWGTETFADLAKAEGKSELIAGRVVHFMASGRKHGRVAANIYRSLFRLEETSGSGEAFTDNVGFKCDPPLVSGRQSFSPDAAYYYGPLAETDTGFIDGPPTFAVEVRSEDDYGPAKEQEMADKRADYFAAGTLVVWDVDWKKSEKVACYRADAPENPVIFHRGEIADAEPALPGWKMPVDEIFA